MNVAVEEPAPEPAPPTELARAADAGAGAPTRTRWRHRAPRRRPKLLAAVELLAAAAVTVYVAWPFLDPRAYVTTFDTVAYSAPFLGLTLEGLRDGSLVQWNDQIFSGATHLANINTAPLYPLKALLALVDLDLHQAYDGFVALHLLLLAVGLFVLVRGRLRLGFPAGFAAVAMVLGSGMVSARSIYFEQITVIAWIPWLLAAIDWVLAARRVGLAVAATAAVTALAVLSGHSQVMFAAVPLAGLWTLGRLVDRRAPLRRLGAAGAAAALGGALVAVQLLPTVGAADRSAASSGRPIELVSAPEVLLQPRLLPGSLLGDVTEIDHPVTAGGIEATTYIGAAALTLAAFGLLAGLARRGARATVLAAALTAALAGALALGPHTPLFRLAYDNVPLFDQARVAARWMVMAVLAAGVLVAYGVDALTRRRPGRPLAALLAAVAAAVAVVFALPAFERPPFPAPAVWAAVAAAVLVGVWWAARGRVRAGVTLAVAALCVELGAAGVHSVPRRSAAPASITNYGPGPITTRLTEAGGRVVGLVGERFDDYPYMARAMRPNANMLTGVRQLDGYDGGVLVTKRWVEAMESIVPEPMDANATLRAQLAEPVSPSALARFGVRWLLVDVDSYRPAAAAPGWTDSGIGQLSLRLYENPAYIGEARIVHRTSAWTPGASIGSQLRAAPLDVAFVDSGGPQLTCDPVDPTCRLQRVDGLARPGPGRIDLSLAADREGLLVVDEQWDPGWRVEVDGREAELVAADRMHLGVLVGPGRHTVSFRYRAQHLRLGLVVSLAGLLTAVGLAAGSLARHRRRPAPALPEGHDERGPDDRGPGERGQASPEDRPGPAPGPEPERAASPPASATNETATAT